MTVHLCSTVPLGEDAGVRRRHLRARARHQQRVGQRRLAAARRTRRQPAGAGHGVRHPQRPALRRDDGAGRLADARRATGRSRSSPAPPAGSAGPSSTTCSVDDGYARAGRVPRARRPTAPTRAALPIVDPASTSSSATSAGRRRVAGLFARARRRRRRHPHRRRDPPAPHRPTSPRSTPRAPTSSPRAALTGGVRRFVHVSSNSPFGTNPHPDRHVPQRRAVPPVLRLRALEDAGRAGGARRRRPRPRRRRSCGRRGSTDRSSRRARRRSSAWSAPGGSR